MKIQVIFVLVCCLNQAFSLKCHQCTSQNNACVDIDDHSDFEMGCEEQSYNGNIFPDGFPPKKMSFSLTNQTTDRANTMEYFCLRTGNDNEVVRSCVKANEQMLSVFCQKMGANVPGGDFYCVNCQKDLCNSSSGLLASTVLLLFVSIYQLRKYL